jgi:hypothetical protein
VSPKTSEAAVYGVDTKVSRQIRATEVRAMNEHLQVNPATKQLLDAALTSLQTNYGDLNTFEKSQLHQLTTWLAAEKALVLVTKHPDIPIDILRQKALLEVANDLETGTSQSVRTLLCLFGKPIDDSPRFAKELAGTIPEDQFINLAWAVHQANIGGDENIGGLFHFIVDRLIENGQPLPDMFSPEDLWVHCFDSHPQQLDTLLWRDDFYHEIDRWLLEQLPPAFMASEVKQIEAKTMFITNMQLLGLSGQDAIDLIVAGPKNLDSDHARYGLKLTNTSWATKTLDQCKKTVAGDIKRLFSDPKTISTVTLALEDGALSTIELDNTNKMDEAQKIAFKNGTIAAHPVLTQLETSLKALCVSEAQIKGVLSGIAANSQVIFVPISHIFNPLALAAGKSTLAGEHSSCDIQLKKVGNDVLLTLKPLGVEWLDCEVVYRIGTSGEGVLTHYHARTALLNGGANA